MELRYVALALAAACSGGKAKAIEDAKSAPKPADAAPTATPAAVHDYRVDASGKTGDVQIRVEWKDTPREMRAPGPVTACGTPRVPAVAPTTLWGIPDVFVTVDVDHGKAFEPPAPRLVLADCAFAPRTVIAGPSVSVGSATSQPAMVEVRGVVRPLAGAALDDKPRSVYLPIAGHEVDVALAADTAYTVTFPSGDVAAVYRATTPYVAVTEASGATVLRDVPVGTHTVRAWLPPRNGGEARAASGTIEVTAGELAEITLDISRP